MQTEHEGAEGEALHPDAHRLGDLEVLDQPLPVMALEENILHPRQENPSDLAMHLINFLDFIEYNFSTLVLMVPVKVLLVPGIRRAFPFALLEIQLVDAFQEEVVLGVGILAVE